MATDTALGGRGAAHAALLRVLGKHQPLSGALDAACKFMGDERERGLARELAFGVTRWLPRLSAVLSRLLDRPLNRRDLDVEAVLLLGLYQLGYTRIPPHAAVAESVSMAAALGKPWAGGLINAVLRRFQREREALLAHINTDETARYSHPGWLISEIRNAWPEEWRDILTNNNAHAPMTLRVNARRHGRENFLSTLHSAGIAADAAAFTDFGLVLRTPVDVTALPGFADGSVSVQDAAGQLAAPLLELKPGLRVLDACAAPGGKTAHILETEPGLDELVALDVSEDRLARVRRTLSRLALECTVIHGDAAKPDTWWDEMPFDRILLDAPCTATGVIRRHPDIKLHRRPEDLPRLEKIQSSLLDALWPLLARGGMLLYATCSILPRENRDRISRFLKSRADAELRPIKAPWGRAEEAGRQILTGELGMDGFYYALLVKR